MSINYAKETINLNLLLRQIEIRTKTVGRIISIACVAIYKILLILAIFPREYIFQIIFSIVAIIILIGLFSIKMLDWNRYKEYKIIYTLFYANTILFFCALLTNFFMAEEFYSLFSGYLITAGILSIGMMWHMSILKENLLKKYINKYNTNLFKGAL